MKKLIFEDIETGKVWDHNHDDWILLYCNFNTPIHPCLLKVGQTIEVKDVDGNRVKISCVRGGR